MTSGRVQEQSIEKQMGGCMAGIFHIFDRHQNFTGNRSYSTKRLLTSSAAESSPESEKISPAVSRESNSPPSLDRGMQPPSPEIRSPALEPVIPVAENPTRSPLPLPIFEFKEGTRSPWRFSKDTPRLSLDSRAVVDAKGSLKPREIRTSPAILSLARQNTGRADAVSAAEEKQRCSPSVIARLMGLEHLPSVDSEPTQTPELRRSASESRVTWDQFIHGINFHLQQKQNPQSCSANTVIRDHKNQNSKKIYGFKENNRRVISRPADLREISARSTVRAVPAKAPPLPLHRRKAVQRKNFFDSADCFPEPPKQNVSICGEIEKRLRMRGIDEPSKDLETLKQILEALQLKGLLRPNKPQTRTGNRNFAYERSFFSHEESPIVVIRPARSSSVQQQRGDVRRAGNDSPTLDLRSRAGGTRSAGEVSPAVSPRRERPQNRGRSLSSPTRSESGIKSPSQRRALTVETQRRVNEPLEQRRISSVRTPKVGNRRTGWVKGELNWSPRNRKPTVESRRKEEEKMSPPAEDASSTVSESSLSTFSPTDIERDCRGSNLLERCGKLLNSIAEMTTAAMATNASELQPSPVSVLDSSFYKETSPSPILKRSIDFKEQTTESEDEMCSSAISSSESKSEEKSSDRCDLAYVSDILRASNYLPDDSDIFLLLEKQQYLKGKDISKVSRRERKLIFDTINEIVERKRKLPAWRAVVSCRGFSLPEIWSEFQKIKERDETDDLFEAICCVLRKDLAADEITGWGDCHVDVSQAVLDIERLIFKDLIGETIWDLAAFAGTSCTRITSALPRRKLVF